MIIDILIMTMLASIPLFIFLFIRALRIQKTYQKARNIYWNNGNYKYYVKHTWNGAKIIYEDQYYEKQSEADKKES